VAALVQDDSGGNREHAGRPRQAILEAHGLRPLPLFQEWTNQRAVVSGVNRGVPPSLASTNPDPWPTAS
jgi:hypothetical protein